VRFLSFPHSSCLLFLPPQPPLTLFPTTNRDRRMDRSLRHRRSCSSSRPFERRFLPGSDEAL
jgi:hypothetical protein